MGGFHIGYKLKVDEEGNFQKLSKWEHNDWQHIDKPNNLVSLDDGTHRVHTWSFAMPLQIYSHHKSGLVNGIAKLAPTLFQPVVGHVNEVYYDYWVTSKNRRHQIATITKTNARAIAEASSHVHFVILYDKDLQIHLTRSYNAQQVIWSARSGPNDNPALWRLSATQLASLVQRFFDTHKIGSGGVVDAVGENALDGVGAVGAFISEFF